MTETLRADYVNGNYFFESTANFETDYNYMITGGTSVYEEAVHYVNFLPDIAKLEYIPNLNNSITYDMGWRPHYLRYPLGKPRVQHGHRRGAAGHCGHHRCAGQGLGFRQRHFNPHHGICTIRIMRGDIQREGVLGGVSFSNYA